MFVDEYVERLVKTYGRHVLSPKATIHGIQDVGAGKVVMHVMDVSKPSE